MLEIDIKLLPLQGVTNERALTQGVASLALGYVLHWAFSPPLLNLKLELYRSSHHVDNQQKRTLFDLITFKRKTMRGPITAAYRSASYNILPIGATPHACRALRCGPHAVRRSRPHS